MTDDGAALISREITQQTQKKMHSKATGGIVYEPEQTTAQRRAGTTGRPLGIFLNFIPLVQAKIGAKSQSISHSAFWHKLGVDQFPYLQYQGVECERLGNSSYSG